MHYFRSYFEQGLEHESTSMQFDVRDREPRTLPTLVPVEQDVQIECPRTPERVPAARLCLFDPLAKLEHRLRRERSSKGGHRIQEIGLGRSFERAGAVPAREAGQRQRRGKPLDGSHQLIAGGVLIRPQTNEHFEGRHARL